jgi:hypothetical protein
LVIPAPCDLAGGERKSFRKSKIGIRKIFAALAREAGASRGPMGPLAEVLFLLAVQKRQHFTARLLQDDAQAGARADHGHEHRQDAGNRARLFRIEEPMFG